MNNYGYQCDAICKNGKRCKKFNVWFLPCIAVYDARITSYRADEFKPVRLCQAHWVVELKLRKKNERLKLHHGGYFGAYNKHKYGNLVISQKIVDWDKIKSFKIPKYWKDAEKS